MQDPCWNCAGPTSTKILSSLPLSSYFLAPCAHMYVSVRRVRGEMRINQGLDGRTLKNNSFFGAHCTRARTQP